jgi:hypothetical protein
MGLDLGSGDQEGWKTELEPVNWYFLPLTLAEGAVLVNVASFSVPTHCVTLTPVDTNVSSEQ